MSGPDKYSSRHTLSAGLAARGGTRVGPRRHDLVRERGARRTSTRAICDDEQRSCRAKSCLPKGLRRRPVPASSRLLSDVPRRLRRHSSPASGRRSQRGPREFNHGLLASTLVFALTGCARSPSFNVLGSYFPGWIACMVAGILLTGLVRFILNRLEWEQRVPALPVFYFSIAVLIACLIWVIAFD
jgi:hypothetical protein